MADTEYKRLSHEHSLRKTIDCRCSVAGCELELKCKGLCKKHYQKLWKYGSVLGNPKASLPQKCEIAGCEREARSRWDKSISVCAMHYLRRLQTGSFDDPKVVHSLDGLCTLDGCSKPIRGTYAKYCERHYYQFRRNGSFITTVIDGILVPKEVPEYDFCVYCGSPSSGKKHCGSRCAARDNRGIPLTRKCGNCGAEFTPIQGAVCCSEVCFAEYQRNWSRNYYKKQMDTSPSFRAMVRHAEYKRKALKRNAFVEHVDRDAIMERDKWVCHLCGDKIPKNAKWPSGLFGTLDHVHPLVKGGKHSYNNIKAAHLSCNCKKGPKFIGQVGLDF